VKHFVTFLHSAIEQDKHDVIDSIISVTMYIINEAESDFFIDAYQRLMDLGIEESKIMIVHALTDAKFPFIEKYDLGMNYIVKYRCIHMMQGRPGRKNVRLSFDLADKRMMIDQDALEYLSEKVTMLSKKLGHHITKLTVVSADYNDLDTLEVLLQSIKVGGMLIISSFK